MSVFSGIFEHAFAGIESLSEFVAFVFEVFVLISGYAPGEGWGQNEQTKQYGQKFHNNPL